jgi:hypothetical protein
VSGYWRLFDNGGRYVFAGRFGRMTIGLVWLIRRLAPPDRKRKFDGISA